MNKPTNRKIKTSDLIVDKELNVRLVDNYDLATLREQVEAMGRIIKPIIVDGDTMKVLSGNRRVLVCKEIIADPKASQELVKELQQLDCVVYTGLTPAEIIQLVFDHGSEKTINRTETLLSVWRLDKQVFSEKAIASMMYFALAKYTGNEKKLREVPIEPQAREKFVHGWFRGTLGNYMLSGHRMGEYIREQMILTHLSEDKMLGDKVREVEVSRDRVTALSAAKTADQGKDGKGWSPLAKAKEGPGFDPATGGENFNKLVLDYIEQDKTGKKPKVERPSANTLKGLADTYKSPAIRRALLVAAGDTSVDAKLLLADDDQLSGLSDKLNSLSKHVEKIKNKDVKDFIGMLLNGSPADVEKALQSMVK